MLVEAIDELYSGVPAVGAPGIQQTFGTSYETTAATLLVVPGVVALVLEPVLFLLADRYPRRWFVVGGVAVMAAAAFAAALAPTAWVLAATIGVAWIASGVGVALAQATLVDARPDARERMMTRWALLGVVGDLLAPALLAVLAALALGWRTGFVVVGIVTGAVALALVRRSFPAPVRDAGGDDEIGLLAGLRDAVTDRRVILWVFASFLCGLLDEILVVFATLHLRDDLGASATVQSAAIGAYVAGSAAGLVLTERILHRGATPPLRLLAGASIACSAAYGAWLAAPGVAMAIVALVAVGVTSAPLYPIVAAQAYAALPGRSGTLHAASHLTTPLALGLPWLLGSIADRAGTLAALAVLLAQPVGLAVIAIAAQRGRARRDFRA